MKHTDTQIMNTNNMNHEWDGYDYHNQAWVSGGTYVRCGHPETVNCSCYGRLHEGEAYKPD
jgi:hypothetical protein